MINIDLLDLRYIQNPNTVVYLAYCMHLYYMYMVSPCRELLCTLCSLSVLGYTGICGQSTVGALLDGSRSHGRAR